MVQIALDGVASQAFVIGGAHCPKRCLKLSRNANTKTVQITVMKSMNRKRIHHSACTSRNRYFVVTGTRQPATESATAERYDTVTNEWTEMPRLNLGRYRHSSCSLLDSIYVFCGMDRNANKLSSIEIFNTRHWDEGWKLIQVPSLRDRIFPAVSPLNDSQILILGGNDAIWNVMNDCYVFDVET